MEPKNIESMVEVLTKQTYLPTIDTENKTDQWLLIRTPIPTIIILLTYLLFVLKIGPKFMAARRPYELTGVMRLYNIIQILSNGLLLYIPVFYYRCIHHAIEISCRELDESYNDLLNEWSNLYLVELWCFLCLKILDLLDTVFMVLRKKNSHITFLHVYHHSAMVFFSWFTLKYAKAHQATIPGLINVFVHMVMYSYYFLATFGPEVQRYLWWKKHLTKLQLTQFAVILVYLFYLYYNGCPISKEFYYIWVFNTVVILFLFVNFYIKAYIIRPDSEQNAKTSKNK